MYRFPRNWLRIWRCNVFWLAYSFGEDFVYDRQEEVGPLLLELPKNGRWVWSASA